jgi:hypothetical protein
MRRVVYDIIRGQGHVGFTPVFLAVSAWKRMHGVVWLVGGLFGCGGAVVKGVWNFIFGIFSGERVARPTQIKVPPWAVDLAIITFS